MAQFDVVRNPGRQREHIPFVVLLQSSRFDRAATRLVAPLVLMGFAPRDAHYLAPRFVIDGQEVVLDVFNLATLPADRLGAVVAVLTDEGARAAIARAMDELLSQA